MLKGILLTLSACFIWGLIFVIPMFLEEYTSLEVALGRYFFYGIISLFFGGFCFQKLLKFPLRMWGKALWFALVANIVYYTSLVYAVQYSDAAITALIAGMAPITVSFYGNWKQNECGFSKLILPAFLIIAGLLFINAEALFLGENIPFSYQYIFGLACAFLAVITWTWFVVANRSFMKEYPLMTNFEWSTMLGVATFFWVIAAIVIGFFVLEPSQITKYFTLTSQMKLFLAGTAVLGCLCSWLGTYLWNSGCILLPVSLGGQMTIFETVFGLIFVYLIQQRLPTPFEIFGITLMFAAIIYSMNIFAKLSKEPLHG